MFKDKLVKELIKKLVEEPVKQCILEVEFFRQIKASQRFAEISGFYNFLQLNRHLKIDALLAGLENRSATSTKLVKRPMETLNDAPNLQTRLDTPAALYSKLCAHVTTSVVSRISRTPDVVIN